MSKVKLLLSMSMLAAVTGLSVAGIETKITDSANNTQTQFTPVADFPAPAADGTFQVEVDFDGIPSGAFSGTVTALDQMRTAFNSPNAVSPGVSYTGTATNLQPLPVTVAVAFS